jgi:hypothetical protein
MDISPAYPQGSMLLKRHREHTFRARISSALGALHGRGYRSVGEATCVGEERA